MFPISSIFHGYSQVDAFRKIQEIFELGKAEVSFMSKSHKSSVNTLVKGARTMNFWGTYFHNFSTRKI
jgi:hypothetical protein